MLASASKLWNTEQGKAIEFREFIHEMISKIITKNDVECVLSIYTTRILDDEQTGI